MKFDFSIRDYSLVIWELDNCGWNLQVIVGESIKYYGDGPGVPLQLWGNVAFHNFNSQLAGGERNEVINF